MAHGRTKCTDCMLEPSSDWYFIWAELGLLTC